MLDKDNFKSDSDSPAEEADDEDDGAGNVLSNRAHVVRCTLRCRR